MTAPRPLAPSTVRFPAVVGNVLELRPRVRTAILLPSGCRFSAAHPNSMETVVRTLAAPLADQDVRIFCCEGADDHGLPGVEILPPRGPERLRLLADRLRTFRPEVIEHHQQVRQAVAIRALVPEAAHLLYRHNALKAPRHWIDRWRYQSRYAAMDGFIFVSEAERVAFARAFPELADRARSAPNPIDATAWLAPPGQKHPLIAFAGRAMPEKGVDVLCAALPAVLDRHPDWRAVLMLNDWDQHAGWAAPHVAALGRYGSRVTVLKSAPLAEVRRQMRTAAIALTPSTWAEPFGLTAVEAHAAGAALISSGRGGLREASGPHALYVDEVTPVSLARAMEHLIRHPLERIELARAAQAYVLETHSPVERANGLLRIRQAAALARRRRGAGEEKSPTRAPGWKVR